MIGLLSLLTQSDRRSTGRLNPVTACVPAGRGRVRRLLDGWTTTSLAPFALGVALAALLVAEVRAQSDCAPLRGDEVLLPGELLDDDASAWSHRRLPSKGDVDRALTDLDYGDELPFVRAIDLNGDGRPELLLTAPAGRLCGNGGCPYVLFAAGSLKKIGEFFGHPAVLDERINGFRIVQSYSRVAASYSSLDTYVFAASGYRLVSHVILDSCGLEQWGRRMRRKQ